jgi:hypothetical protein
MVASYRKSHSHALLKSEILAHITRYGDLTLAGDTGLHDVLPKSVTP